MKNFKKVSFGQNFEVIANKGNVYKIKNKRTGRFLIVKKGLTTFKNHLGHNSKVLNELEDLAQSTANKRFNQLTR